MTTPQDLLQAGMARAGAELGTEPLPPEGLGVALAHALHLWLTERVGEAAKVRQQTRSGEIDRASLRPCADEGLAALLACAQAPWLDTPENRARLIDLAIDTLLSEPLAPPVLFSPVPLRLLAMPVHALVFSAFPHITHELYPLMVDAYVADLDQRGAPAVQVVGVHKDWLQGRAFRRAIVYDAGRDLLCEGEVAGAPAIATAQVLALDLRHEQQDHAAIEAHLPLLNPLSGAHVLDDKAATGRIWLDAGLPTPAFADGDEIPASLGSRVVIKPAGGTEGAGAERFNLADPAQQAAALAHLRTLRPARALIAEERGSLRYASPDGPRRCTVRLNLCWDGATATVESGYAQVAGTPDGIASAGRGGRIIPLTELWSHLCREDGAPVTPTHDDWPRLLAVARAGVEALAAHVEGLSALIGLDLLLDAGEAVAPVLLEANPRPAGMSRCRLVTAEGPTDEPGVAPRLWQVVRR